MAGAKNFDEAIAQLKAKYPHRSQDIDFIVAHMPELAGSIPWQQIYDSVEAVIEREERRDQKKAAESNGST